MTGRNGRSSWEQQGIIAFCTCQWNRISHKQQDFLKNITEHKMCVSIFSTDVVWNIFHSTKNWARYDQKSISVFTQNTHHSVRFEWNINFLDRFSLKNSLQNFTNIHTVEAELFHAHIDRHYEC
jgi:hypothetical protein